VQALPQTAHSVGVIGPFVSMDFFADARISGEITGSGGNFRFILVFTIEQIDGSR
jgi:hypothetical protein